MSRYGLPLTATTSLDAIAPGVSGLRLLMVNVFAVTGLNGSWSLVDTGLYFCAGRIRRWAEQRFGMGARPDSILLTHGHFDHVGSVCELARQWDVPVYAHPLEMPYLDGRSKYPPPDPAVGGGAMALLSPLYPRGPLDLGSRLQTLPAEGAVPGLPDWRWIHTPGHTPGHVSFFRESDRVLIAGDAVITTRQESFFAVATQMPELHGPPAYYTSDWEAAALSAARLAELLPNVMACGHGLPVSGPEVADALDVLAAKFDQWARPSSGRYVREPAVSGENGVITVPPALGNPVPAALAAGVLAAAAGWYVVARRRHN